VTRADDIGRREFLRRAAAGALVLSGCRTGSGATRRPNVVYAFADEHRWQSLGFTETPTLRTPHLARLAEGGTSFTYAISNYPVCSPQRAIVMSGRWPWEQGVIDNGVPLAPTAPTLGTLFRDAGWATAYVGKWHLGGVRAEPFGFEHSLIWTDDNEHWDRSYYHPKDEEPVRSRGYNATGMTDQALAFIRTPRDRPFFLMLSWNPPHANMLDAPAEKLALYPAGSLPQRRNGRPFDDPASDEWHRFQGYHAHVSAIDDEVGRLVAALDEAGIANDTLLVYTSDHGSMLGAQGVWGKRQPYEESIRVPFLARWPGVVPAGRAVPALFGAIDVLPTLCGLAGVPVSSVARGRDYAPWLRGDTGPDPEAQLVMHLAKKAATGGEGHPAPLFHGLRTRRFTYAARADAPWILFDDERDPFQLTNLVAAPEARETLAAMRRLLADLRRTAGDVA
jgi:arylsulfatase A-like enzyme